MKGKEDKEEIGGLRFEFHSTSNRPEWVDVKLLLPKETAPAIRIAFMMALVNKFPLIAPSMSHKVLNTGAYQVAFVLHDKQAEKFRTEIKAIMQSKHFVNGFGNPN